VLKDLLRRPPALPDAALEAAMAATVEAAKVRHALSDSEAAWRPGEPLRLLFVGYVGTRNTGADVRVAEMLRQVRCLWGDEAVEPTIVTSDMRLTAGYFPGVRQVKLPDFFPPFLWTETARNHGVVACEGSMFKSTFASALTTLMTGALGLAVAQNKVAIGYGAEAGDMDPALRELVSRYARGSLIVCRNEPSRRILEELSVRTAPGTDTAWTFEPEPRVPALTRLAALGRSPDLPLLVVCPINPFWWPVRPAVGKALLDGLLGRRDANHYRSFYYHDYGAEDRARFEAYLAALAESTASFAKERGARVLIVGMERLDREACERLALLLRDQVGETPVLVSDEHDMHDLVSILREATWLVTSRYHAAVCSTAGGVPAVGVTMDERLKNLLDDRGHARLCVRVDDPDLATRIGDALRALDARREEVAAEVKATLPGQLEQLGRMGLAFAAHVRARYPELPPGPATWRQALPPLAPSIEALLASRVTGAPAGAPACA
jgi:polysaccharide pyruvyl transferase WcaK-like protein